MNPVNLPTFPGRETSPPRVTIVVPSFNQGRFLEQALSSIFLQDVPVEVFVMDAGSTDGTPDVLERWRPRLTGLRIGPDRGQAAAINEGIARGGAPYVCWLNSDDWLLEGALRTLIAAIETSADVPAVYGRCWNVDERAGRRRPVWVEPFVVRRLALRCIVSQPATLIRRSAWETVGGLDESLHMAMDYDLWWRLSMRFGPLRFIDAFVAANRVHEETKTDTQRRSHYREAMEVVRRHHGRVPFKWWLAQPFAVWYRSLRVKQRR